MNDGHKVVQVLRAGGEPEVVLRPPARALVVVLVHANFMHQTPPVAVPLELVGVVEVVGVPVEAVGPDVLHFEGVPAVSFTEVVAEAARAAQLLVEPGCDPGEDVVDVPTVAFGEPEPQKPVESFGSRR